MSKEYISPRRLSTFFNGLKNLFATKIEVSETNQELTNRINGIELATPTIEVVQETTGATVTTTDKNGTTEAFIANGKSGVHVGTEEPMDNSNVWINPEGKESSLVGKSAYEIALDHGFEGSEEEWLGSLVGDPGPSGTSVTVSSVIESTKDSGENIVTFSDGKTIIVKNGSKGTNGTSVTVTKVTESAEDGGSNVVTFSDGKTLTAKNGRAGTDGDDGISVTHSWNGTVLTITSASGTSSANLKGENGNDYILTADDKADIAAQIGNRMTIGLHTDGLLYLFINDTPVGHGVALPSSSGTGGDVVGNVDSDNNIVLLGNLAEGDYRIKYEMENGSYIDIGTLTVGETSIEINLFTTYTPLLNKRYSNSSQAWKAQDGCVGFELPMVDIVGKTMRFSGFAQTFGGDGLVYWYAVNDSNTLIKQFANIFTLEGVVDEGNNTYSWVVPSISNATKLVAFLPIKATTITEQDFENVSWTLTE